MFTPWIRRSALKRKTAKASLRMPTSTRPNYILLLSLIGLFIAVGIFVLQHSYAAVSPR